MLLTMTVISFLLGHLCIHASPLPTGSAPKPSTPLSSASTPVETAPIFFNASSSVVASSTQIPAQTSAPDNSIIYPQLLDCQRWGTVSMSDVREAIRQLWNSRKKRCYQGWGNRPGDFGCTRVAGHGTAVIDLCGGYGWTLQCANVASWATAVQNGCFSKPEFFFHYEMGAGRFYPPEGEQGATRGAYVRVGKG